MEKIIETSSGTSSKVIGTITVNLFDDVAPTTCRTFRELASGVHGYGYKGTNLHRILPNCVIQGGIIMLVDTDGRHILYENTFRGKSITVSILVKNIMMLNKNLLHDRRKLCEITRPTRFTEYGQLREKHKFLSVPYYFSTSSLVKWVSNSIRYEF